MNCYILDGSGPPAQSAKPAVRATIPSVKMPWIRCEGMDGCCGAVWGAFSARLRLPLPDDLKTRFTGIKQVLAQPFIDLQQELSLRLNLPSVTFLPGIQLGYAMLDVQHDAFADMEWTQYGTAVVTERMIDFLMRQRITGWQTSPIQIVSVSDSVARDNIPFLRELVIVGKGGTPTASPPVKVKFSCSICGRTVLEGMNLKQGCLDESQWDGSDLFMFEPFGRGAYMATERVKSIFTQYSIQTAVFEVPERRYSLFSVREDGVLVPRFMFPKPPPQKRSGGD